MGRFDGRFFPSSAVTDWAAGKFGAPGWVPNEPDSIEGTVGDESVALTWTAGRNNGADVTGWYIEKYDGSWSEAVSDTGSATAAHTVTGLTNGQAYTFRIKGINSVGLSEVPSTASGSHSPLGAPLAPGTLSLAAGSPDTTVIGLSWSAGNANGATITGYKVQFSTDASTWSTAVADTSSTATTYSISSGLSQGTLYHIRVAAINSVGVGVYSNLPTLTTASFTAITATGGTTATYTSSGISYKSHKFTSSGNFAVSNAGSASQVDVMVVGGGGGGSSAGRTLGSGGGGAGGVITSANYTVSATTYAVVIGAGGNQGANGSVSTGFGLTGGYGGYGSQGYSSGAGTGSASNGSAGGGSGPYHSGGGTAYSPGTGGDGGDLVGRPYTGEVASIKWGGGGGGGAGADGTSGSAGYNHTLNSGNGGAGISNTYMSGSGAMWAGGGGGGGYNYKWAPQPYWSYGEIGANPGYGGSGGGGKGTYSTGGAYSSGGPAVTIIDATAGTANTGGGGGGGASAGSGGSGVVVVRYRAA